MKKILAVAIVLVMIVAMVACEASKGDLTSINDYVAPNYTYVTETGTFTFAEAGGNTAVITGYVGKAEPHAVVIPAEVTVASLEENANNEDNVRKIVGIDDQAFYYCTALTAITIPANVQKIGDHAFSQCKNITSVEIPGTVTRIGSNAFYGCSVLKISRLPNSVTSIRSSAFSGCTNLISFAIPDSITSIGE